MFVEGVPLPEHAKNRPLNAIIGEQPGDAGGNTGIIYASWNC